MSSTSSSKRIDPTELTIPPRYFTASLNDDTEGFKVCNFIEKFIPITSSSHMGNIGDPVKLMDWQEEFFQALGEYKSGKTLRYRRALLTIPKKNGKSWLMSAYALAQMFLLPDNGVIVIVATTREQASLIFNEASKMAKKSPALKDRLQFRDHQKELINKKSGTKLKVYAADPDGLDGVIFDKCLIDEQHRHKRSEVYTILANSLTKPNSQLISVTTAGDPRDQSLLQSHYEYGKKLHHGETQDDTFLFRCWEASGHWEDPETWKSANPSFGQSIKLESLQSAYADAISTGSVSSFQRLRLNMWVATEDAWKVADTLRETADKSLSLNPGDEVILGFDGSYSGDSTAIVAVRCSDLFIDVVGHWKPTKGNEVKQVEVIDHLRDLCKTYKVKQIAADDSRWSYALSVLEDEGLPVLHYPQRATRIVPAITKFEQHVRDGAIKTNGNPVLIDHMSNCVMKYSPQYQANEFDRNASRKNGKDNDAAVCAVMAFDLATIIEPEAPKPTFTETWAMVA